MEFKHEYANSILIHLSTVDVCNH